MSLTTSNKKKKDQEILHFAVVLLLASRELVKIRISKASNSEFSC
jgi:hypothetical protein